MLAGERAGGACVVEMDVRQQQVLDLAELAAALGQPTLQRGDAGRRPAIEERETASGLDEIDADRPGSARMDEIDRLAQ